MRTSTKHPLLRVRKKNLDITIGPSAIGVTLILVIAALIATGFVSPGDAATLVSKLRLW